MFKENSEQMKSNEPGRPKKRKKKKKSTNHHTTSQSLVRRYDAGHIVSEETLEQIKLNEPGRQNPWQWMKLRKP